MMDSYLKKEKNRTLYGVGCNVVIFCKKRILLLKRSGLLKYRPNSWDLPGGKMENGENPYEAIKREVIEETKVCINNLIPFSFDIINKIENHPNILSIKFIATSDTTNVTLSKEHIEYFWLEKNNMPIDLDNSLRNIINKAFCFYANYGSKFNKI